MIDYAPKKTKSKQHSLATQNPEFINAKVKQSNTVLPVFTFHSGHIELAFLFLFTAGIRANNQN